MFGWLKKWTSHSAPTPAAPLPVHYQGYDIYPEPLLENGQYRINGRITRHHQGQLQEHRLVRCDLLPSAEQATALMIAKAQRVIDENGSRLFS